MEYFVVFSNGCTNSLIMAGIVLKLQGRSVERVESGRGSGSEITLPPLPCAIVSRSSPCCALEP